MLEFRHTKFFFDRPHVARRIRKGTRRQLGYAGGMTRKIARRSIRPATKKAKRQRAKNLGRGIRKNPTISKPGKPPKQHTKGRRNLKLILYAFDPGSDSLIVGPLRFKSQGGPPVPALLERGGTARRKGRMVRYRARPFMQPALEKAAPKFPDLFKNSVR